jgi:transcriptional regulator with XRE-family HTH domain
MEDSTAIGYATDSKGRIITDMRADLFDALHTSATPEQRAFLRWRRQELGLPQRELALRADCSESLLKKIEQGRRPLSYRLARRLERALDCPGALVDPPPSPSPPPVPMTPQPWKRKERPWRQAVPPPPAQPELRPEQLRRLEQIRQYERQQEDERQGGMRRWSAKPPNYFTNYRR